MKNINPLGLFDDHFLLETLSKLGDPLQKLSKYIGWSIFEAVNLIRARAKMPDFPVGMSKEAFMNKLRNERRVELAFEDHRFWDIRRWKIGNSTTDIYGVNLTKDDNGTISYTRKLVENRVWDDRMNLYPISQNELYLNKKLIQNSGW